jgi:energy-coupling factor transporter ATP-binding protein EcfA2
MATTDLLTQVLAPEGEGYYCIVGLRQDDGRPKQTFHATIAEAATKIDELLQEQCNVYFACAKYKDPKEGRIQPNGDIIKAFWIDIDCGLGKPYADQAEGLSALKEFCAKVHLPLPTIVNSGRGIHAYWRLTTVVDRLQWKPVAERLKALCEEHEFFADPTRTADNASILRVPETFNFKDEEGLPVEILAVAPELEYEAIKSVIGVLIAPDWVPKKLDEVTKSLLGNKQSRFKTIMMKTMNGKGCAQLENIVLNQDSIEEPLWRAGLSIAAHCIDRDEAIHKISMGHPEYSPGTTEKKAAQIKGPYICETFQKINPSGCSECPNKGQISSPIQLGSEIVAAEESVVVETAEDGTLEIFDIPEYPFPYFRGKNGGVYVRVQTDEDGEDAINIYEHDFYIVKRLYDPAKGESLLFRLHLPRDGVKEFAMAATDVMSLELLKGRLGFHGVLGGKKQMEAVMSYVITSAKNLQHKMELEVMRNQFGWADKDTKFIVGEHEISADKVAYSPPSTVTGSLADHLKPTGEFDAWKKTVKVYDTPGFEPHAFGFFTAFGAPLLKHLNFKGGIINLINNTSGTGKSTILKMCNSVWGHPEELMLQWKDTMNSIIHRMGVMNNLPVTIDEVTKLSGDHFSDLAYSASQGRGKNRMQQHSNAERINATKWATIVLCSSNASFYDKLSTLKSTPDGEFMRLLEYKIDLTGNLTKEEADTIFNRLYDNYGHAGIEYAKYLVSDLESAIDLVMQVQQKLDKAVGLTNRERFWSAICACNIAGALIAKDLGIIDFDIKRVYDWIIKELKVMRTEVKAPTATQSSVIGEFMNSHRASVLVINGEADKRSGMEQLPILEPKFNDLFVRIEPDNKHIYINAKQFRKYCSDNQITLKDVLGSLKADKAYLGQVKKRLGKGTKIVSSSVDAYLFDMNNPHFQETDHFIEEAKTAIVDVDSRTGLPS